MTLDDDDIGTCPPEFLRHQLKIVEGEVESTSEIAEKMMPWSHDVWNIGITLLEIVNCLPIYLKEKAKVVTSKKRRMLIEGLLGVRKLKGTDRDDQHVIE